MYTHFRLCAGILNEKTICEKMSKTFVCCFPKVTWFSFRSLQLLCMLTNVSSSNVNNQPVLFFYNILIVAVGSASGSLFLIAF